MLRTLVLMLSLLPCWTLAQDPARPSLYIIGDSTVRNNTPGQMGWGDPLKSLFDAQKITVENHAIGGRSSRTFLTEGRWQTVLDRLKPGDFVVMQFGHNDGGPFDTGRARASIRGVGEETKDVTLEANGQKEIVYSFGHYMRRYIEETKAKGAHPIVVSLIPRNMWQSGKVQRNDKDYALWAKQTAEMTKSAFIDFNQILAKEYELLGESATMAIFATGDHTHTNQAGARFHAQILARELRAIPEPALASYLLPFDESLRLARIFSDHMVAQRDQPFRVWGWAKPGAELLATIAGQERKVTVGSDGAWRLEFAPLTMGAAHELVVKQGSQSLVRKDILVGEVWLCSGQSNMDFTVAKTAKRSYAGTKNAEQEIAAANHPQIRMFTAEWQLSSTPMDDVAGEWKCCSPETVGDFSAVAYFFGRELQKTLQCPIGLITSAYGASTAEAWIPRDPLVANRDLRPLTAAFDTKCGEYANNRLAEKYQSALATWEKERDALAAAGKPPRRAPANPDPVLDQHNPSVLYNGMIFPLQGYTLRGVIWYQGESNLNTRKLYPQLQQTLIEQWRSLWKSGEMPFYFVQLAPRYAPSDGTGNSSLAEMREAQALALRLPHTGMVVTTDCGEEKDVHPRDKQTVGHRLAALALGKTYQKSQITHGPMFRSQEIRDHELVLHFDSIGSGLKSRNGTLAMFAIAAADRKFVPAEARIEGDSVIVQCPSIAQPLYARYAWSENPAAANLINAEGFPAAPFRTDGAK